MDAEDKRNGLFKALTQAYRKKLYFQVYNSLWKSDFIEGINPSIQ